MAEELLLLSSSVVHGGGYLDYVREAVAQFLTGVRTLHFVPFARADHEIYTGRVAQALQPLGVKVIGLHSVADPVKEIENARAVFIGGGNSFRLLKVLQTKKLLEPVRKRVQAGELRFMGASAGTNMACPSLRTTNDMPIVQPASFEALNLLPFQINPHYLDPDPTSTHRGETREERLVEFLEENEVTVLGLREGAWLYRKGNTLLLEGQAGARLFQRRAFPREYQPGCDLSWLLTLPVRFDSPLV